MTTPAGELAAALGQGPVAVVEFRGERLEIRPLVLADLPAFSRLVGPIVAEFFSGSHPEWLVNDEVMLDEVLERHGESIIEAAAIATGRSAEFIGGNDSGAELVALARAIVEGNRDFFIRKVRATRARQSLAQSLPATGDGPTPSTSLSPPVTH